MGGFILVGHNGPGSNMMVLAVVAYGACFFMCCQQFAKVHEALRTRVQSKNRTVEDRLEDLEELKQRNLITPEEYAVCCFKIAKEYGQQIAKAQAELSASPQPKFRSVEDRLDDLERLKRRDMVTPEEYAAKRQEILKDL